MTIYSYDRQLYCLSIDRYPFVNRRCIELANFTLYTLLPSNTVELLTWFTDETENFQYVYIHTSFGTHLV